MKYYSSSIFTLLITLYILAVVATTVVGGLLFMLSGMGCSAGCPSNYEEMVIKEILLPAFSVILFLIFSIVIIFLQQRKNHRLGYFMLLLAPIGIYITYKILSYLPILDSISYYLKDSNGLGEGVIWLLIASVIIIVAIIPFYVLGKLVKEDLFKKFAKR